jgi:hypothetical protein
MDVKLQSEIMNARDHLIDLDIDEKIILRCGISLTQY